MNLSLEEECIHTLRFLSIDAVEKAHSGHPGLPLGAAPMAFVLWDKFLKHNPNNPQWFNHDRFILSAGHGCALLYSLLHCYGYPLSLDELKNFRQWGSLTPGHPEYHHTPGVEATTGPLGQGFGMGVGMAIAEQFLSATFNKPGFNIVDHYTYAIVSDGDLMEGVSSEAASLAGTLKCGKLIYLYDDNHISIEGDTALAFTEDVEKRFLSYHWHVIRLSDGNNLKAIEEAIKQAQNEKDKPSLIIIRTHIGFGSPKQDSAAAHGEPLGKDAVEQTRNRLRWHYGPFEIPETAQAHFTKALPKGHAYEAEWKTLFDRYKTEYVKEGYILETLIEGKLPIGWDTVLSPFQTQDGPMATRSASGKVMNQLAKTLPHLIGGSADLAPSTKTILNGFCDFGIERDDGRNLHFGVREHGMGAAVNGMALHGGIIPYGATFLIFSDYMRPSIRLSSLMKIHSIFVFTHDSIGLGEDGPTHQPIEHLMSLRAIPGFTVIRPADANETVWAWKAAIALKGPVALVLTRQNLPVLDPETLNTEGLLRVRISFQTLKSIPPILSLSRQVQRCMLFWKRGPNSRKKIYRLEWYRCHAGNFLTRNQNLIKKPYYFRISRNSPWKREAPEDGETI